MPPNFKQFKAARKYGYRSGLELKIAESLKELKVKYDYECIKIEWEDLAYRTYTPDFVLFNGIIIAVTVRALGDAVREKQGGPHAGASNAGAIH